MCGACKERGECLVLLSQLAEHELQLCTVLGSIIGLATHQGVSALAYIIDFLRTEFRHLGHAASRQYLLRHIGTGISGCRVLGCLWQSGQSALVGIGIDAEQKSVAAQAHQGSHCLAAELDAVGLGLVGYTIGFQRDALYLPAHTLGGGNAVEVQVTLGVLVEVTGLGHCLVCLYGHPESSAWEEVGYSLQCAARHKGCHLRLSLYAQACCQEHGQGNVSSDVHILHCLLSRL